MSIFVTMLKTDCHIKSMKRTVWMWFILFSLSPCTLKAVVVDAVNADFAKTLNKAKTTTPINYCQYTRSDSRQTSIVKQAKLKKKLEPVDFLRNQHVVVGAVKIYGSYSKSYSGNSPPKYVLFKRWKFGVA